MAWGAGKQGGGWQGGRAARELRTELGTGSCPRTWRLAAAQAQAQAQAVRSAAQLPAPCALLAPCSPSSPPHAFCLRMAFGFGRFLPLGHGWSSYRLLSGLLLGHGFGMGLSGGLRPPGATVRTRRPRRVTRPPILRPLSVEKLAQRVRYLGPAGSPSSFTAFVFAVRRTAQQSPLVFASGT